ncbi:hypothetical protein [Paenibacillus polymyxa]|uniref:hypothetical protein n=1 Tax=Paenibacillus polymyxa TaxID=1406 RepID=UPI00287F4F8D|nr:hypothetical protein [Paenibacillus polymyxa]
MNDELKRFIVEDMLPREVEALTIAADSLYLKRDKDREYLDDWWLVVRALLGERVEEFRNCRIVNHLYNFLNDRIKVKF